MPNEHEALWIAMSDLWLDDEPSEERLQQIAAVVRESGLTEAELEDVFVFELAPFLGPNHRVTAGEWTGFDPDWVCTEARARQGKRRLRDRLAASLGLSTYAARPAWRRVKEIAFRGLEGFE